jgi:hypothetical protein
MATKRGMSSKRLEEIIAEIVDNLPPRKGTSRTKIAIAVRQVLKELRENLPWQIKLLDQAAMRAHARKLNKVATELEILLEAAPGIMPDTITTRDNNKMVRLVSSPSYRQLWGDRFFMTKTGERRIENNMTGFKLASSAGGVGTGERGDRVILDDPHNVIQAESELERTKTVRFFRESMSNRINDDRSAIVIIMQRLHENDVSGDILARESDYCHCMIPMYFEPLRYPASADGERTEDPETGEPFEGNDIGWIDPRALDEDGDIMTPRELARYDGELAWPDRFSKAAVKKMEYELGQYAFAGQYQQSPTPRKGGIFKREYWQCYVPAHDGAKKGQFPEFDFVIVSVDSAYTEKEENDPTGCTTWGIWTDPEDGFPKIMLLAAWRKHLPLHGEDQPSQERGETGVRHLHALLGPRRIHRLELPPVRRRRRRALLAATTARRPCLVHWQLLERGASENFSGISSFSRRKARSLAFGPF